MAQSQMDRQSATPAAADSSITVAIVERVAAQAGVDPLDLPPLAATVDPDAVNTLVATADQTAAVEITFSYEGYTVTVTADRSVTIQE